MAYEVTCTLIKPHITEESGASERITDIIRHYLSEGLVITDMKCFRMDEAFVHEFYEEHVGKDFFHSNILPAMTQGMTIALALAGRNAVQIARRVNGNTDPAKAEPGTLRAKYGSEVKYNAVHASDSRQSAIREISLVFG